MGRDEVRLRVQLLGEPVVRDGADDEAFASPRLLALLGFLVLHRHAAVARRRLAFLFWPDSSEAQARTNLRQTLHHLRRALGEPDRYLKVDAKTLHWRADAPADVDVVAFERLSSGEAGAAREPELVQAVGLYGGELLAGFYDDWIGTERERLRRLYVADLCELLSLCDRRADIGDAVRWGTRLLRAEPYDEAIHRYLMDLYARLGDRARAVHVYHACASTLERELGLGPDADTVRLYDSIRRSAEAPAEVASPTGLAASGSAASSMLVGREPAWDRLVEARRSIIGGGARVVMVWGEPGIGKSCLTSSFLDWCRRQGTAAVASAFYEAEGNVPYAPVVDVLRSEPIASRVRRLDPPWRSELARLLPELHLPHAELAGGDGLGEGAKQRLFEAVARALVTAGQPLVWALDDLHWADGDTLALVHFVLRFAPQSASGLLLLGTARPVEVGDDHPLRRLLAGLRSTDAVVDVPLGPLDVDAATELVTQLVGAEEADAPQVDRLVRAAEGNPLFMTELARSRYVTRVGEPLPARLRAVIEYRLSRLTGAGRDVASIAAVLGRAFSVDVLAAAAERVGPGPRLDVVDGVDELWRHDIVRERGDDGYDFSHGLIRDVAYALVAPARRRRLHAAAAAALEEVHAERPNLVAAQVATHHDRAGDPERAVAAYRRATVVASRAFAYDEVIAVARRGLELVARRPEGPARDDDEIALLEPLGVALYAGRGVRREDAAVFERAAEIRDRQGRPPDPSTLRVGANYAIAFRDFPSARRNGVLLLRAGRKEADGFLETEGHYLVGVTSFWLGELERSRRHLSLALDRYRPAHRARHLDLFGQDPQAVCLVRLGFTLFHLGQAEAARSLRKEALGSIAAVDHSYTSGYVRSFAAWHAIDEGDPDEADRLMAAVDRIGGHSWFEPMAHIATAWRAVGAGRVEEGIEGLRLAARLAAFQSFLEPLALILLARALTGAGRTEEAVNAAEEALEIAARQMPFHAVDARLALAGALLARGAPSSGVAPLLQAAIATAADHGAVVQQERARVALECLGPASPAERIENGWSATISGGDTGGSP